MRRSLGVAILLLLAAMAVPGFCQQPGPPGGQPGFGPPMGPMPGMFMMGPGMGMMGQGPGAPTVTMLVVEGVLYLACDGKLTAYDAKTLKVLAQVTYWQPQVPPGMPGMPGAPPGPPPGPPPAAP